jgi:hypothetical protein
MEQLAMTMSILKRKTEEIPGFLVNEWREYLLHLVVLFDLFNPFPSL